MTKSSLVPSVRVGVHEAKSRLSELLRLVDGGQEVEILRGGEPIAKIVPLRVQESRQLGVDQGVFTIPDDFDSALPDDVLDSFLQ